jgi:hypothetical protein
MTQPANLKHTQKELEEKRGDLFAIRLLISDARNHAERINSLDAESDAENEAVIALLDAMDELAGK